MNPHDIARRMNLPIQGPSYRLLFSGSPAGLFWGPEWDDSMHIEASCEHPFILMHEITHAIGVVMKRKSLLREGLIYRKRNARYALATRVEEAIADLVAETICLSSRAETPFPSTGYPPVTGKRTNYYVQRKAEEALEYILKITSES